MFFTAPLLSFKTIDERTLEKRGEKETSACALQAALQRGVGLFAYFFIKMQGCSVASVDKGIQNKTTKYGLPTY